MSGPTPFDGGTEPVDRVQRGLDLLFAAEVSQELAAAIDVEALRSGAPIEEAIDGAKVGAVLGEPAGRLLVRGVLQNATKGGIVGVLVRELAGRAGAHALRTAFERANTDEFARSFERTEPRSTGDPRWKDDWGVGTDVGADGSDDGSGDPVHIEIESPGKDDDGGDADDDDQREAAEDDDGTRDNGTVGDEDAAGGGA